MTKLKTRKRLTALVIAFMLTFTAGAAFAFASGTLDIVGTISVAAPQDLYVIWSDVTGDPGATPAPSPSGIVAAVAVGATQSFNIVDERGRTDQRIEWTVNFYDDAGGAVSMIATATNNALLPALISDATVTWTRPDPNDALAPPITVNPSDFGLTLDVDVMGDFEGAILAPGAGAGSSADLVVMLEWDGTAPSDFTVPTGQNYAFATTLTISFNYTAVVTP